MVTAALLRKKSIFQIEYLASTLDSTQHILAQTDFYIWYSELYVIHSFEMHTLQDLYGYWAPAQICSYGRTANSCGFFPPLSKGSTTYWSNMILPNLKDKINIKKKNNWQQVWVWGGLRWPGPAGHPTLLKPTEGQQEHWANQNLLCRFTCSWT